MRKVWHWLKDWLKTFTLFWEYLRAASQHWQEILGGTSVPLIIWTVWFFVGNPPTWINWTVVLLTVLIAGYFVWRADHIRLIPKLKIAGTMFQDTPVTRSGEIVGRRTFVQLLPQCLTESPVYECVAYLQRIERRIGENQSEEIALHNNSPLGWSEEKVELHSGADKPLN